MLPLSAKANIKLALSKNDWSRTRRRLLTLQIFSCIIPIWRWYMALHGRWMYIEKQAILTLLVTGWDDVNQIHNRVGKTIEITFENSWHGVIRLFTVAFGSRPALETSVKEFFLRSGLPSQLCLASLFGRDLHIFQRSQGSYNYVLPQSTVRLRLYGNLLWWFSRK